VSPTPDRPTILGLDPSAGASPWAWALLDDARALVGAGGVAGRGEAVALALHLRPALVAVDAPLSFPLGMDCLEPSCGCRPAVPAPGRACEREVVRRGLGLFFTTPRSIIKPMVYQGVLLRRSLEAHGVPVIEVYPAAMRRLLLGRRPPRKGAREGQRRLREALAPLVPHLERLPEALGHHGLDALLAALVGWMAGHGLAEALGWPEEGLLFLPQGDALSRLTAEYTEGRGGGSSAGERLLCTQGVRGSNPLRSTTGGVG
jgi:predicted nuclease with RNAse H fold